MEKQNCQQDSSILKYTIVDLLITELFYLLIVNEAMFIDDDTFKKM